MKQRLTESQQLDIGYRRAAAREMVDTTSSGLASQLHKVLVLIMGLLRAVLRIQSTLREKRREV